MTTQQKIDRYLVDLGTKTHITTWNYEKRAKTYGLPISTLKELSRKVKHVQIEPVEVPVLHPNMQLIAEAYRDGKIDYSTFMMALQAEYEVKPTKMVEEAYDHNWIFIGDLHEPFADPRYFEFIKRLVKKYGITKAVFVGDEIDMHFSSYHETNPDGLGARDELRAAKEALKKWYDLFPEAVVCEGNHSTLAYRKATSAGLASDWLRSPNEVLGVPNWRYMTEFETNRFVVGHGDDGKNMQKKIMTWGKSYIQGHFHSESGVKYITEDIFAMQVGCGVDKNSYAFRYAGKGAKNFILSAGVLVDSVGYVVPMK